MGGTPAATTLSSCTVPPPPDLPPPPTLSVNPRNAGSVPTVPSATQRIKPRATGAGHRLPKQRMCRKQRSTSGADAERRSAPAQRSRRPSRPNNSQVRSRLIHGAFSPAERTTPKRGDARACCPPRRATGAINPDHAPPAVLQAAEQRQDTPDTPSERASNERHERHFSVKISPVTPTSHIMRMHKTAGQAPFEAGSRIATHST